MPGPTAATAKVTDRDTNEPTTLLSPLSADVRSRPRASGGSCDAGDAILRHGKFNVAVFEIPSVRVTCHDAYRRSGEPASDVPLQLLAAVENDRGKRACRYS
jgi:hypothetical protein